MRIKFTCFISFVFLTFFLPCPAFPWGSLYPGETHQYIISTAYNCLKADPAFSANLFPTFSVIKEHEGVKWTADGLFGVGPDGKGMSAYSDHYYNPITQEGNGPNAAAKYYSYLTRENVAHKVTTEASGKAAAWSAHYLADMFVPYHVIGTTRRNAERIWKEQSSKHPGTINLGYSVIGSYKLSYATPIKGGDRNFNTELSRFITKTNSAEADWFDAWYYNGNSDAMMINTSSHVAWEAAPNYSMLSPGTIIGEYHRRAGQGLPGFSPQWQNATPAFKTPWDAQAEQVRKIAILSATETRKQLENYFDDPAPALAKTIQTVYSMWRSSFSGLRPTIEFQPDGPNSYKVTGTISNSAGAAVKTVQARLTAQDCTVSGETVKTIKNPIPAGGNTTTSVWNIKTVDKLCRLNLEVIGSYPIPDLQYALVERTFFPAPAPPDKPKTATSSEQVILSGGKGSSATPRWVLINQWTHLPKASETSQAHKWNCSISDTGASVDFRASKEGAGREWPFNHRLNYRWGMPDYLDIGSTVPLQIHQESTFSPPGNSMLNRDVSMSVIQYDRSGDPKTLQTGGQYQGGGMALGATRISERADARPVKMSDPLLLKVPNGWDGQRILISVAVSTNNGIRAYAYRQYEWRAGAPGSLNASKAAASSGFPVQAKPPSYPVSVRDKRANTSDFAKKTEPANLGDEENTRQPPHSAKTMRWYTHATGLYRFRLLEGWNVTTEEGQNSDTISENGAFEIYPSRRETKLGSMAQAESRLAELVKGQLAKYPGSQEIRLNLGSVNARMVTVLREKGNTLWFIYFAKQNATNFIGIASGSGYGKKELPAQVNNMLQTLEFLR